MGGGGGSRWLGPAACTRQLDYPSQPQVRAQFLWASSFAHQKGPSALVMRLHGCLRRDSSTRGWGVWLSTRLGWRGLRWRGAGSGKLQEVGSLLGYLAAGGKALVLRESGAVVPLLTSAAAAPWRPVPPMPVSAMLHTTSLPRERRLEGAHHH